MNKVCVCVLAYNEQKHIEDTVYAILEHNDDLEFDIVVYANGCTDKTADIVRGLSEKNPNLRLRELAKASKPNAWNTAFAENTHPVLFFSDGDVRPEPGSIVALRRYIDEDPGISLVCSRFCPDARGLTLAQHLTAFLQTPLSQDFHAGGFYAIRRSHFVARLHEKGLVGIPEGIVGEDEFLGALTPRNAFVVARERVFSEPPILADFWKYLARLRWQEEQINHVYGDLLRDPANESTRSWGRRLRRKLVNDQGAARTLLGIASAGTRTVVKSVFRAKIDRCYRELGPVCPEGRIILSQATRSESAK